MNLPAIAYAADPASTGSASKPVPMIPRFAILENGQVEYYIDTSFMAETIRNETRYSLSN
ncbi:hypothetical protein BSU04_04460 [Caballeronia sordidicola]|jgi:hypothetical protein|uniref:Uncharacterized protein n=1 Tax=Caballeronia sordidicola TaxID=196367 RepID=A0A226XAP2_CABSO|nr:hypothetical protein BSU04_04460 [Caballeronia sordidicola]